MNDHADQQANGTLPESEKEPSQLDRTPAHPCVARFMLRRYVRLMDNLPMTPAQNVGKILPREDGITFDAWDLEALGIKGRYRTPEA